MSDIEKSAANGAAAHPQYAAPPPQWRPFANPGPLGLYSFASTTLILSLYNVNVRGIKVPNVVVGMAIAVGGLAQMLAGIGEFFVGNTFGFTAFVSYGGFWWSYAALFIPDSGIAAAYAGTTQEADALGIWLLTWFIVTFLLFWASLRSNLATASVFFFLFITFILLGAAEFTGKEAIKHAGGAFGIVTAFLAFYAGTTQLYTPQASFFTLPAGPLPKYE